MSTTRAEPAEGPKTAFLFPGQGAQVVGMGQDLLEAFDSVKRLYAQVDEAVGAPLSQIFLEGPEEELRQTLNTQPAILTVSLACLTALQELADNATLPTPAYMAGHSLGEYTALVVAGALEATQAAVLVRQRGRLMQEASDRVPSGMAAIIGLDQAILEEICQETGTQMANMNSADQVVIAGEQQALDRAVELASARGAARAIPLRVSGAFHSRLMEPAMPGMASLVQEVTLQEPQTPVIANCTATALNTPEEIREELIEQLCSCVRWKDSIDLMVSAGVTRFVEIGPGRVLTGLVRRISPEAQIVNLNDLSSVQEFAGA